MSSPRVQRKKQKAYSRILIVAEQLMRKRGVEEVTVQDITQAADVGHGTFYLHFKSKMDVLIPIAEEHAQTLTALLDDLTRDIEDPAEVVAISIRHLLYAIEKDPLWSWFLFQSGWPSEQLRKGVGDSGRRDIARGMKEGRFITHLQENLEPFLLGAISGVFRNRMTSNTEENTIEECAYYILLVLGIDSHEAAEIANRPLPALPTI